MHSLYVHCSQWTWYMGFALAKVQGGDKFDIATAELFSQRLSLLTMSTSSASITKTWGINTEICHTYYIVSHWWTWMLMAQLTCLLPIIKGKLEVQSKLMRFLRIFWNGTSLGMQSDWYWFQGVRTGANQAAPARICVFFVMLLNKRILGEKASVAFSETRHSSGRENRLVKPS